MDSASARLTECFELVFPDLAVSAIPAATQKSVEGWDSVAAITLVSVIEEKFDLQMDFERIGDLDSYEKILRYLVDDLGVAG